MMNPKRYIFALCSTLCLLITPYVVHGASQQTPPKDDAVSKANQLPAKGGKTSSKQPDNLTPVENAEGGTLSLAQLQGKVVLLVFFGRGSTDAANTLMREVIVATAKENEAQYVLVGDLKDAPGFFRGAIRGGIKKSLKARREALEEAFKRGDIACEPRHNPALLLDWQGSLKEILTVVGSVERLYQAVVLNREGKVTFRVTQPDPKTSDSAEKSPVEAIVAAVKNTLAEKPKEKP